MTGLLISVCLAQTKIVSGNAADLQAAVSLWREFSMPIPPATAVPILLERRWLSYGKVISLLDRQIGKPDVLYVGGSVLKPDRIDQVEVLSWKMPTSPPEIQRFSLRFTEDPFVSVAIQSQILGHRELADDLYHRRVTPKLNTTETLDSTWIGVPRLNTLKSRCALLIATHLVNSFCQPKSDGQAILKDLVKLDRCYKP